MHKKICTILKNPIPKDKNMETVNRLTTIYVLCAVQARTEPQNNILLCIHHSEGRENDCGGD